MVKWTRWTLAAPAIAAALSCDEVGTTTTRPAGDNTTGDEGGSTATGGQGCIEDQLGGAGLCLDAGMWALEAWQTCSDQGLYLADFAPYDECGVGLFGRVRVACCGGDGVPDGSDDQPTDPRPDDPCACDTSTGWCPPECSGGGGGTTGQCFEIPVADQQGCYQPELLRDLAVKRCLEAGAEATAFEPRELCDDGAVLSAVVTCCLPSGEPQPYPDACGGCPPESAYCTYDPGGKPYCAPIPDPSSPCNCPADAPYCVPAADGSRTCVADPNQPGQPVECWTDCDAAGQCWTKCSDGSGSGPTPAPDACSTECDSAGNCKTFCPSTGCVEEKRADGTYAQYCPDGCNTLCDPATGCTSTCPDQPPPPVECWTECDAAGNCWTQCSDGSTTDPNPPTAPVCQWTAVQADECLPYDVLKQQAYELCAATGAALNNLYPADDCPGGSTVAKVECCGAAVPPVEPPPDPTLPPGACQAIQVGAKGECLDAGALKEQASQLCAEAGLTLTDVKPAYDCSSAFGTSSSATATCCAVF